MSTLYSEPLLTNEVELFPKFVPEVYQDFFNVFSQEEANNMPPHSHIYPVSGTELSLLWEILNDMLCKGSI